MDGLIWKQFRDLNYEVSSNGDIRNSKTGRILKQRQQKEGYMLIDLFFDKKNKTFRVHRMVAEVFLGARGHGWEVDHKNKLRNDNRAENLRWLDKSDNSRNRTVSGIFKEEIEQIISLYNSGLSIDSIYLKLNNKIL